MVGEGERRLVAEPAQDVPGGVLPLLQRGRRHAGNEPSSVRDMREIADDEHVGRARHAEVGRDDHAAGTIERNAQRGAQRRGRHPCGPHRQAGLDHIAIGQLHAAVGDGGHRHLLADPHAQTSQRQFRLLAQVCGEGRQDGRSGLDQHHARGTGVDGPEVAGQGESRKLGDGTGQFDAGRSRAHHHEREQSSTLCRVGRALGTLERQQQPAPDQGGILQGLEAGCMRLPFVVTEIGMRRARRDDEVVVRQLADVEDEPTA